MAKKSLIIAAALFLAASTVFGGAFDKGGVLGVGARATGMGDAFGAIADDGSAVYWNVAGLTQLDRSELDLFIGPLLNGKQYYTFLSFGSPFFQDTAWQLSVMSLIHNDKNNTKEFTVIGSFAANLNLERTFSVGVNVKYLNYNSTASYLIPGTTTTLQGIANGLGFDMGVLYQIPLPQWGKKLNFGLFIQDVDTTLNWSSGTSEEKIPTVFKLATAYYPEDNLVLSADFDFFKDMNISGIPLEEPLLLANGDTITALAPQEDRIHVGIEGWFFKKHLGLRGGYTAFATMAGRFTGGVTYKEDTWEVDYSYIGHAEHLGDSHRLSVILRFGQPKEQISAVSVVRPPKELKAYPANNAVSLTWEPNDDPNVTGYAVYMSKSPGARYIPVAKRVRENYITVGGLQNGTRYYFVVVAINNTYPAVESAYSNEVSAVPAPVVPGTPEIFPVAQSNKAEKNGAIDFVWGAKPAAKYAGYNVYITETTGKGYVKVNASPINDTHYVIKGLEVGKKYFYVVTSVTRDNPPTESRYSKEFSDIAKPESTLPGADAQQPAVGQTVR
ncbi:MAG: PorV/PorQ family protein [Spirochaetia bacterium]|nr:PorV/PorQ family protein [Spirochaetia bacterium]